MDPKPPQALSAPGTQTDRAYAPGRGDRRPAVDERLVAPEAHAEILDGRVYRTMGSNEPHGTRHFAVTMVFAGCLADGYEGAVDMLTRADEESDAAPDVSVFPTGPDPVTGGRKLEEIAFEVLDSERLSHVTHKVEKFAARGVRRLFCVRVKTGLVYEWSHEHHDWQQVEGDIVDRCFRVPIPVRALVDRVAADDTVARALLASRNSVLAREVAGGEARGEARGALDGRATSLLTVLAARSIAIDETHRAMVFAETDVARLDAWIIRAVTATALADVFG